MLKKLNIRVWTRCSWLQIGTSGGLLWALQFTSVILKVFYPILSLWRQTRFQHELYTHYCAFSCFKMCHAAVDVLVPGNKYVLSAVAEPLWCSENELCWLRLCEPDRQLNRCWQNKGPNVAYWNCLNGFVDETCTRAHTHTHTHTHTHVHTHTHTHTRT